MSTSSSATGAISPSTGRTLPDRYIEGTCPICGYDGARGDQCDNCGNQLDAAELINPRSRINGEVPKFVETEHVFLDLPAFTEVLGKWLASKTGRRPNVLNFTRNLVENMRPRPITRDLDWGVTIPLDGWREQPLKKFYVWFDAVIGYFSASVEWARRTGDADAWRGWWNDPDAEHVYFMGKDNITFHAQIWPALLLGHNGQGDHGGQPGPNGELDLPSEIASSEFLTMSGSRFSTSRWTVIYLHDFLREFARTRCGTSSRRPGRRPRAWTSPGTSSSVGSTSSWPTSGATWSTGRSRWRTATSARSRRRAHPPGPTRTCSHCPGQRSTPSGSTCGVPGSGPGLPRRCGWPARPTSTYPTRSRGNSRTTRPSATPSCTPHSRWCRTRTHCSPRSCRTPPSGCTRRSVAPGCGPPNQSCVKVDDLDLAGRSYPVQMGDYASEQARWASTPIEVGRPLDKPSPLFGKLDPALGETGPEWAPIQT